MRSRIRSRMWAGPLMLLLTIAVGCGDDDDAPVEADANVSIDAPLDMTPDAGAPPDADVDAGHDAMQAAPQDRSDITPMSGHVSGGIYEMDVQLGHPVNQGSFSGGSISGDGAATIKP